MTLKQNIQQIRDQFPSLRKTQDGNPVVFFDGPAGTQCPQSVIDAISKYLTHCNANHGGKFLTSRSGIAWIVKYSAPNPTTIAISAITTAANRMSDSPGAVM